LTEKFQALRSVNNSDGLLVSRQDNRVKMAFQDRRVFKVYRVVRAQGRQGMQGDSVAGKDAMVLKEKIKQQW
jgi:hypothetical protein